MAENANVGSVQSHFIQENVDWGFFWCIPSLKITTGVVVNKVILNPNESDTTNETKGLKANSSIYITKCWKDQILLSTIITHFGRQA